MSEPTETEETGKSQTPEIILPDNTPVDLQEELRSSNVQEVLDQLDRELIGLKPVKTRIRETAALLLVDRVRNKMQLSAASPTLPVCRPIRAVMR